MKTITIKAKETEYSIMVDDGLRGKNLTRGLTNKITERC